jgi:hypothetical protein
MKVTLTGTLTYDTTFQKMIALTYFVPEILKTKVDHGIWLKSLDAKRNDYCELD